MQYLTTAHTFLNFGDEQPVGMKTVAKLECFVTAPSWHSMNATSILGQAHILVLEWQKLLSFRSFQNLPAFD